MIAALFVQRDGCYYGLPDVDPWDEERDARLYRGPHPVVAHPPCARWCLLAGFVEARYGYKRGDDGGCFASALASVRRWGGVLEHPAFSAAWSRFYLPRPLPGGWQRGLCGGWSAQVEQWHYGHKAKKATWLYSYGVERLPSLVWTHTTDAMTAYVSRLPSLVCKPNDRTRLTERAASATPSAFRDVLLDIARSVPQSKETTSMNATPTGGET